MELPDGIRAEVRSDGLAVGTTTTVYRSDSGAVFGPHPQRPSLFEWALCAAIAAAAVVLAVATVRGVRRLRRSS